MKTMSKKWVYLFDQVAAAEEYVGGDWDKVRGLLGGKGAGIADMTRAALPVPPGFTITTEACNEYFDKGKKFPAGMWDQVLVALRVVEEKTGKKFGDAANPLLVSVRSGAKFSMPGMMDTVLNVGLNPDTLQGIAELTDNERFANDAYRRLVQMFGKIVKGIEAEKFEHILDTYKARTEGGKDTDLTVDMLKDVVRDFKALYKEELGEDFPDDPHEQLSQAIEAVFASWFGAPAVSYRTFNKIPHDLGTGVNVQTMVFGNMGLDSGTGVAFTRDPATGEEVLYGEYLMNAQGEDVVAGIRTPHKIAELEEENTEVFEQFEEICRKLENHYRDVQDVEFTIERGKLWMLQTRTGKRTAKAAVKIAVDMVEEGLISRDEALQRMDPNQINHLLLPRFDLEAQEKARQEGKMLAKGLNASPGAATGVAVFDADRAEERGLAGEAVVMVRPETVPDDVHGMLVAKGILTQHGGATSHAAVVARGLGKPCVAGCEDISINLKKRQFEANGVVVKEGDNISIDGTTGEIFVGIIATIEPDFSKEVELATLLEWADEVSAREEVRSGPEGFPTRGLQVWANADYPQDAQRARDFGAMGIGLCRTEHMFFEEERLPIVQKMILAESEEDRQEYLDQLLPFQRGDFEGVFEVMDGLPVIIRLIDPPLHEFLPSYEELVADTTELRVRLEYVEGKKKRAKLEKELAEKEAILEEVAVMRESNPMLGLRGIRLGITMPGITKMQVRAIFEAACNMAKKGVDVHPEVMIPLTGHVNELKETQPVLEEIARQVMEEKGIEVDYKFGTMIEIPRAALTADEIAEYSQFFSFGTNDLTQTTFGYSRDDAEGKFLLKYVEDGILPFNPFQTIDREGVGRLVKLCVLEGRAARPELEVGICGEHGGDPDSVKFCHEAGLNYVSCSPFRVPLARLAAAQAVLEDVTRDV
jgi:pyruvate,orthophosphate dikinase